LNEAGFIEGKKVSVQLTGHRSAAQGIRGSTLRDRCEATHANCSARRERLLEVADQVLCRFQADIQAD
jgi:hypothetical protein